MLNNMLTGPHLLVIVLILVLLFGAPKLPALAKSLGQSMRILKAEVRNSEDENTADSPETAAKAPDNSKGES